MRRVLLTILLTAIVGGVAVAQEASLTCAPFSTLTLTGSGAAAGVPLLITFGGRIVGGGVADGQGRFRLLLQLGQERPGSHRVTVETREGRELVRAMTCVVPGGTRATPALPTAARSTATARPAPAPSPTTSDSANILTRAALGDAWPFNVEQGVVRCLNGRAVVFDAAGKTYAVNGTAISMGRYADIQEIWIENPALPGTKVSMHPIIETGLRLCE